MKDDWSLKDKFTKENLITWELNAHTVGKAPTAYIANQINELIEITRQKLIEDFEKLEDEKSILEKDLNSGKLSSDELTEKSQRIGAVIEELDIKSDRWLELSEKI